jgi:phosphoribosylpyrophosphate synthetase
LLPVSYSVGGEALHRLLADYKRRDGLVAERATRMLAGVLWQFLLRHETCVAAAADVQRFDFVTTVPSGDPARDERHPLRRLVGEMVGPTRARYERLLLRNGKSSPARRFDPQRYRLAPAASGLRNRTVLLIDDTWTTGASARSAAAALRGGGARAVAAVVIGRYVNRGWHENNRRLEELTKPFEWSHCALCANQGHEAILRAREPTVRGQLREAA